MVSLFKRDIVFHFNFIWIFGKDRTLGGRENVSSNINDWNIGISNVLFCWRYGRMACKRTRLQYQPVYTHPEMFDENGNVLPDEILAVRFENDYGDYDEDEEEG